MVVFIQTFTQLYKFPIFFNGLKNRLFYRYLEGAKGFLEDYIFYRHYTHRVIHN